jgi:hypothetical protein
LPWHRHSVTRNLSFTSLSKDEAIIIKCLAQVTNEVVHCLTTGIEPTRPRFQYLQFVFLELHVTGFTSFEVENKDEHILKINNGQYLKEIVNTVVVNTVVDCPFNLFEGRRGTNLRLSDLAVCLQNNFAMFPKPFTLLADVGV